MTRHRLSLLLFAALLLLSPRIVHAGTADAGARVARFTVVDGRADEEISEVTRLYVDGTLVATFRLDDRTHQVSQPVSVPEAHGGQHDYALCGEITIRNRSGAPEIHEVSSQGVLDAPDGRVFAALGARDFTLFYLADPSDPQAVRISAGRSPFCQTPVS